jgi:hypothetical protein
MRRLIPLLLLVMLTACQLADVTDEPTESAMLAATATETASATDKPIPTLKPTKTPTATPTPLPTAMFTGSAALPGSIFALSPVGDQWMIGNMLELWAITPKRIPDFLGRFTPFAQCGICVSVSPDQTMLAFSAETGGALYYPATGQVMEFSGVNADHAPTYALESFAWSADSQTLYYVVYAGGELWQLNVTDTAHPQLLAENLRLSPDDCELHPAYGLPDGRLLMACYLTERSIAAVWNQANGVVTPLTYQNQPIHIWDMDGARALFDTGPQTPLLIGEIREQGEMQTVVEVQAPDMPPSYSQPLFLPDNRVVAVWYDSSTEPPSAHVVLFSQNGASYKATMLSPAIPETTDEPYYQIAVYGDRVIVQASDLTTGATVLSQVPLDGSAAIPLAEGTYQIVIP